MAINWPDLDLPPINLWNAPRRDTVDYSSDKFDGDIRSPLYDLTDTLNQYPYSAVNDESLDRIYDHLLEALHIADDYRVDLMDAEDEAEDS